MKLHKIAGYVGAGLMMVSCDSGKPVQFAWNKAENMASRYINGTELIKAQKNVVGNSDYQKSAENRIFYWDSLLAVKKKEIGKKAGTQFAQDSLQGKPVKRPNFDVLNVDRTVKEPGDIVDGIQSEVAKHSTGAEMKNYQDNQPGMTQAKFASNHNNSTHYWGQIAIKSAERRGFEEGVANELNRH